MSIRLRPSVMLLFVPLVSLQATEPAPDCNANGLPDAEDVTSGRSEDLDRDGLPDECVGHVRVIDVGPGEVTLAVTHRVPIRGFTVLVGHDSAVAGHPV